MKIEKMKIEFYNGVLPRVSLRCFNTARLRIDLTSLPAQQKGRCRLDPANGLKVWKRTARTEKDLRES